MEVHMFLCPDDSALGFFNFLGWHHFRIMDPCQFRSLCLNVDGKRVPIRTSRCNSSAALVRVDSLDRR